MADLLQGGVTMKRQLPIRRNAVCNACGRRINLILYAGTFRRHVSSKGVVCDGSWKMPQDVKLRQESKEAS